MVLRFIRLIIKETKQTDIFLFEKLSSFQNIEHFVSTNIRKQNNEIFNDLNLSFNKEQTYCKTLQNRKILADAAQIPLKSFVMQEQVHGNKVKVISKIHKSKGLYDHNDAISDNDAMITNEKDLCLFLFAADCVPILFYDPEKNIIGAAHAGWKGTLKKIASETVLIMKNEFGCNPEDMIACLGPSISVDNYEVGDDVVEEALSVFGKKEDYLIYNSKSKKYHFDLWFTNKKILLDTGIKEENIQIADMCTYHHTDKFFSARRQKNTGRFAAGIMMI